ncbi:MAG: single-stranded-DNA-specific exonuclease RecJ [Anaerolineae bacterium]
MPPLPKIWKIAEPAPPAFLAQAPHLHRILAQILFNRGLRDPAAIESFLQGITLVKNPYNLKGLPEAVTRIRRALRQGERIAVYGDFDADGVTATTLLVQTLRACGGQVEPYIPHRVDEGYGLNNRALTFLRQQGFALVITVDCGIRSVAEAEHARALGLDLIITDHHHVGAELPDALAVINPRQPGCRYGFSGLAGVGVAYRVAQGILRAVSANQPRDSRGPGLDESDLLDLVALGTVADIVPLLQENRELVRQGLVRLNRTPRVGLQALMQQAGVTTGQADTTAIGFRLAPRINAAGRLQSAMLAYQLLSTQDQAEATALASQLGQLNTKRQELTEQTVQAARRQIEANPGNGLLLLAEGDDFLHGVVGLAAGKLTEEYYRPTIVIERGPDFSHGSARSIPAFHITRALDRVAHLLERHGGHEAAAGFKIRTERLPQFREEMQAVAAAELSQQTLLPLLEIDAVVRLSDLDFGLLGILQQLEPCGQDNRSPVLLARNCKVLEARTVGGEGAHLKLLLSDGGPPRDAIAFRQGHWLSRVRQRMDVVFALETNEYNGNRRLQLNVHDLKLSDETPDSYQPSFQPSLLLAEA